MAEETQVAGFIEEAGVLFVVQRSVFNGFFDIAVEDHGPVQGDLDLVIPLQRSLLVPFAGWQQEAAFGSNDAVDGAVILSWIEILIHGRLIVKHLDLHPDIGRIALQRGADADAVVCAGSQLEFKAVDEIGELLLCIDVTTAAQFGGDFHRAFPDGIADRITGPLVQVLSIEQGNKTFLLFRVGQDSGFVGVKFTEIDVPIGDISAVRLEFDLFLGEDREGAVPIVFERDIVGDQDAVEPDRYLFPLS